MRISRAVANQTVDAYATALFDAAQAESAVDTVGAQLAQAVAAIRAHAQLRDAILDDTMPLESRVNIVREVFGEYDPALVSVLALAVEREHMPLLGSISQRYTEVAEERRNVAVVEVTTAVELTDPVREAISKKLAADLGKEVSLRETVDPSIVGGIVIKSGGRVIDASVNSQLESARVVLSTAQTGGEA